MGASFCCWLCLEGANKSTFLLKALSVMALRLLIGVSTKWLTFFVDYSEGLLALALRLLIGYLQKGQHFLLSDFVDVDCL